MSALIQMENIVVDFDGFHAIDGLDFWVDRGEVRFLIGPNGAGKTTLIDVITGMAKPTAGKIVFDDRDITRVSETDRVRAGIGRTFQAPSSFMNMTVAENVDLAENFTTHYWNLFRKRTALSERALDALERVGLAQLADTPAGALSHGQKKWLEIAMLLVQDPTLILLDEPVAGMTTDERRKTGELIHSLLDRCTVLIVEHDMSFLREFANRVSVLHQGKLLAEGSVSDVQQNSEVQEVYLGRSQQSENTEAVA